MSRNTPIALNEHSQVFIDRQIRSGRYGSASDVVRAGLRLLEERDAKIAALRAELIAGEQSGAPQTLDSSQFLADMRIKHGS